MKNINALGSLFYTLILGHHAYLYLAFKSNLCVVHSMLGNSSRNEYTLCDARNYTMIEMIQQLFSVCVHRNSLLEIGFKRKQPPYILIVYFMVFIDY